MGDNQNNILLLTPSLTGMDDMKLDSHIGEIQSILDHHKNLFPSDYRVVNQGNLQTTLLNNRPKYVHFAGHGCADGIFLEGKDRQLVTAKSLRDMFKLLGTVQCVLLISCETARVADTIVEEVDYVIGMKEKIYLREGNKFSFAFYDGLVRGLSIKESFDLGCSNIDIANLKDDAPVLRIKNKYKYLLTVSEKTIETFQEYKGTSATFKEHIQKTVANELKPKVHPDNIGISNISFDKSLLTVMLPLEEFKKENLLGEQFIDIQLIESQSSAPLKQYAMKIDELKDVHHNLHKQLGTLEIIKTPVEDIWKILAGGKNQKDFELRQINTININLRNYEKQISFLTTFAKKKLSFESVPLVTDEDGNPSVGPEWAVDILTKNIRVRTLFTEIYPPRPKCDFYKFSRFKDEFDDLFKTCYLWLGLIDKQIKENVIKLMAEL